MCEGEMNWNVRGKDGNGFVKEEEKKRENDCRQSKKEGE